ncbi:MAG: alginate lyase family protein, partial [Candidatus Hinthialibacter sp.]
MQKSVLRLSLIVILSMAVWRAPSQDIELHSLPPQELFSKLDLNQNGLESVQNAVQQGRHSEALAELLAYYRIKYPPSQNPSSGSNRIAEADNLVNHIFQWGPYEAADYGDEMNWEWDPRGDIEWVAAVYRFYWAQSLASAYESTKNEKYAQAFVELTTDWIQKHPLENHRQTHPVYTHWRGFPWLDIQTGIRATNICQVFPTFVHAKSFTPEFLGVLMASLYDHQVKTERLPMNKVHNKAIFEQRGFINIAYTFPEFKESKRWMELAIQRVEENLLAQTTEDGVQREWSGGYHTGVLRDAVEIMERVKSAGLEASPAYRDRVRKMYDYIFWIATPDLGYPMFGDTSRPLTSDRQRTNFPLYQTLHNATNLLGDSKYAARADLIQDQLLSQTSYAFSQAGMYVMRDAWGADQIYLALHCSPPAISSHDQPDNGTFELCAFGRWLMPDTGFYTYGHDAKARAWHRRTRVHQTLTLDEKDSRVNARERIWHTSEKWDALIVENQSYKDLIHRRSVWFVDEKYFVFLDEAMGKAAGALDLHFQFAPGETIIDPQQKYARTDFADANVLVWAGPDAPVTLEEEEGWFAWKYGARKPRSAIRMRHKNQAPAVFCT